MNKLGAILEKLGTALAAIGGICFAGIFLIVLLNGTWPEFLEPVRNCYAAISDLVGSLAFLVELVIFVGPGLLVALAGQSLRNSRGPTAV